MKIYHAVRRVVKPICMEQVKDEVKLELAPKKVESSTEKKVLKKQINIEKQECQEDINHAAILPEGSKCTWKANVRLRDL